ncbi:MAG: hypothetical protein HZB73_05670, partial [Nitrosarchaeum sp.]|nr:hypothetical protein [Nitrosarchaeum sp.]
MAVTTTANSLVVDAVSHRTAGTFTPGAGQTTQWDLNPTSATLDAYGTSELATTTSTTMSETQSATTFTWVHVAAEFKPSGKKYLSESVTMTDSLTTSKTTTKNLSESLPLSDNTVGIVSGKSVSLSESLPLSSTATTPVIKSTSLSESLPLSAALSTAAVTSVSLSESLPLSSTAT